MRLLPSLRNFSYSESIEQGDLVVAADDGDFVKIGFYSKISGVVCLYALKSDSEPEVFNESELTIIGKIIGYCDKNPNERGRFYVNLLPNTRVK